MAALLKKYTGKYSIVYCGEKIPFRLFQSQRTTLEISVLPDLAVEVRAPLKADLEEIRKRVHKRSHWIRKQQREFETYLPRQPERKYITGETHRYLGRQYRLKILKGKQPEVKLNRGFLLVTLPKKDNARVKSLLNQWFEERAAISLQRRFEHCLKGKKLPLSKQPHLEIRKMKTRWGSCGRAGKIILNPELVHASTSCIDYVIIHELCHLIERTHNKKFYRLLTTILPDWKHRQRRLNQA